MSSFWPAALITARALALLRDSTKDVPIGEIRSPSEHIIMIGANHLSALYIKLVRAYSPSRHRVVAVLDDQISLFGRRIVGVPVVSTIAHIDRTIEEFEVHGVCIDRIIVGGNDALLSKDSLAEVERVCHRHDIELQFVPHLIGLHAFKAEPNNAATTALKSAPSFVRTAELSSGQTFHRFLCECRSYLPIVTIHRSYFITGFDRPWFACGFLAAAPWSRWHQFLSL